jgi:hypothetical protein
MTADPLLDSILESSRTSASEAPSASRALLSPYTVVAQTDCEVGKTFGQHKLKQG